MTVKTQPIFGMWTAAGVLIRVLTRSPALAVGPGLVWSLVVENLLEKHRLCDRI